MSIYQLFFLQNFNAMRIFLHLYIEKYPSVDLTVILASLHVFKDNPDWKENPLTWDPAAWDDWMNGVYKTLKDMNIQQDPKNIIYDENLSFLCMTNFLYLFYQEIPYEDVGNLLARLNDATQSTSDDIWNMWLQAVNHSIHDTFLLDGGFKK